jgi:general secretion pathway protein A
MYERYFGLAEPPFSITPDPRYLYLGEQHTEALAHLVYGVTRGGGFIQLTGEVGTGKTTLIRRLLDQLPADVNVALILNPRLDAEEFLLATCEELGVDCLGAEGSVKTLVDRLNAYLLSLHADGRRAVLIVDEAQNLARDTLEQVRLLTNLETSREKLLQMILVGQPELRETLARDDLRQLAQRITARFHLAPLDREEVASYVRHRAQIAGGIDGLFSTGALGEVSRRSQGIPRVINVLCDRALLGAYTLEHRQVSRADVRRAWRETWLIDASRWPRRIAIGASISLLLLIAVLALSALPAGSWGTRAAAPIARATDAVATPEPVAEEVTISTADAPATTIIDGPPATAVLSNVIAAQGDGSVYAGLAQRWGLQGVASDRQGLCALARAAALRCDRHRGGWATLQALDLPVIIELALPDGSSADLLLIGLDGDRVGVATETGPMALAISDLISVWHGDFVVLWHPHDSITETIWPGANGPEVAWLREALARLDLASNNVTDADHYDTALRASVVRFQRSVGLRADGIAGTETLIALTTRLDGGSRPSLGAD